ncbi:MAG TPA: hypothetical protein VGV61_10165 [Thermoanaerobaculia bacterium]|nr:hypothetical protein [Thermoanaerobaculia bacterium]
MRRSTSRSAALLLALAAGSLVPQGARGADDLTIWVDLVARGVATRSPPSWLAGGTGRLAFGDGADHWQADGLGEAQLGLDWRRGERFAAHLHGRGRAQRGDGGAVGGLVEAWAQATANPRGGADRLRLRAGQLFLPTSRENVAPLWSSPYTLSLSALNSWIGEEVRPLGLLVEYDATVEEAQGVRAGVCVFGGNDTSGALLAWRGWAMGDRLSVLGEALPLPPLPSLATGGAFGGQDRDGTTAIDSDLDGRPGWAGYLRYRRSDAGRLGTALVQLSHFDNRGDRALHRGQYAWDTTFDLVGGEVHPGGGWTLAAEHMRGRTAMGLPRPRADATFRASYLLASWEHGAGRTSWRATLRWDGFATRDRDHLAAGERSDEDGQAWTAALLWHPQPALGIGVELLDLTAHRPALAGPGRRDDGGRTATLGIRWRVGSPG